MKNKPLRHKEANTFKFQPFSERIASINIDVFHHVGHINEAEEEDNVTFFYKTLQKCNDLNLSKSYEKLKVNIGRDVQILAQLIAQKEKLVSVLSECLDEADPLSLQHCLELVVALAQDLRQEFYPFYPGVLEKVINLLNRKNTDQLEWTFTCLAYLFKYLWRFLVKNLNVVFEQLLPLLSSSKPQYVNNFAAESFAFVARKVKDKRSFLKMILKNLKRNKDSVSGCGRLLFEVMNGVQGQFHTCAQVWLQFLFESLVEEGLPFGLLLDILTHTVTSIATAIHAKHSKIFWDILQETILKRVSSWRVNAGDKRDSVADLLHLVVVSLEQKQCCLLANPKEFINTLNKVITGQKWSYEIMELLVKISSMILLSTRLILPQDVSVTIIQKIMSLADFNAVKLFINNTLQYSGFEMHILPSFLQLCSDQDFHDVILQMTKIILAKSSPAKNLKELRCRALYPLHCSSQWKQKIISELLGTLSFKNNKELCEKKEEIICSLIILPNLAMESVNVKKEIKTLTVQLINSAVQELLQNESSTLLFFLSQALATIFTVSEQNAKISGLENLISALIPFVRTNSLCLQALELYINLVNRDQYEQQIEALKKELIENLASPFHKIRLLSASILQNLEEDCESEVFKTLGVILTAENINATVDAYRDKLRHLQMLECSSDVKNEAEFKIPLNYLLGNLYVNFKLMWEPVSKLIVSYAKHLPISKFWPVFLDKLNLAVLQVAKGCAIEQLTTNDCKYGILSQTISELTEFQEKPDFFNNRLLLWQLMSDIPEVCEGKNRDISALFLNFLKTEYYRINPDEATTWNIKKNKQNNDNGCLLSESGDKAIEENMEVDTDNVPATIEESMLDDEEVDEEEPSNENIAAGRTASKSLLAHLSVFRCLRNPRSMFREPELNKAYYNFLSHKNPDIQKSALDCIMNYKFKFLIPYKDHLYGLINDKTFKTEVAHFRIDVDNEIIRPEHRADVIPIVMRIIYSKMLNRSGVRTGSRSAKQDRRSIVFRFLAGCKQDELLFYMRMAFRVFTKSVQDDTSAMVRDIHSQLDLSAMVPPKRLLSTVNLLASVFSQCGSLLSGETLTFLLRVLLCAGATVSAALAQREHIYSGYLNILRKIRNSSIAVLTKFFSAFESYPWTTHELNSTLEVFVWPYLSKLPNEGIHSPTSLMKLFMVWSSVTRYFPLLISFKMDSPDLTPLPYIMSLLVNPKTHGSVVNAILDSVYKLLSSEDDEEPPAPLPLCHILPISHYSIKGDANFSSKILFPHISAILCQLKHKLSRPKSSLGPRDLGIMSQLTSLVNDPTDCESLIMLVLPVAARRARAGEHIICPLINTLTNLVRRVAQPHRFIRTLAPLFSSVIGAEPRRMLSELVNSIDTLECGLNAKLLEDLNAWDAKWLNQPDFNRRLDAFKAIENMNSNGQISVEQGIIIIYTCYHFLSTEKDMSLKDSASQCLQNLCPSLCKKYSEEQEFLVNKTILNMVSTGIRDKKNDTIQQESIILLGCMARNCADLHPVLKDLSFLTNKADMEVDFFENLLHLQLHRRVRALLKFCEVSSTMVKLPCTRTLTQFVLPIVSHYLCSERYKDKNTIVDAAIELETAELTATVVSFIKKCRPFENDRFSKRVTQKQNNGMLLNGTVVGTVCKMLPWHQYEIVLRYYLGKLTNSTDYQKQLIHLVVRILNSFHFDLKNADLNALNNKPSTGELSKEKKANEEKKASNNEKDQKETSEVNDGNTSGQIIDEDADNSQDGEKTVEEDLGDILDKDDSLVGEQEENVSKMDEEKPLPILERQTVLSKSLATRVIHTIQFALLPKLHRTFTARTQSDAMHKVNRKMAGPDRDEEDILRIPIALACVKLLQRLPEEVLLQNISGLMMKTSTFLKSRLDSVRRVTRDTLQKMVIALGPSCLHQLIREMSAILTHGFHVHVLVYSVHSVLVAIKPMLKEGDIDASVPLILEACKLDMFGKMSEEKEVKQIAGNLMEARANRSYDMYHILAQFISQKCLLDLIIPIKEELGRTLSLKVVNKGRECLKHMVLGLLVNQFLTAESLLIFAYGTATESIPALLINVKEDKLDGEKPKTKVLLEERVDSFLIPKEPKRRASAQSKVGARTNAHIFVEFGLSLYHFLLKREKVKGPAFYPHLNPVVKVLEDCLKSDQVKISTLALQCLTWMLRLDLPSVPKSLPEITRWVFKLLHKYAAAGLSKGDNFNLVMAAFKVVAVILRDEKYKLSKQQHYALLVYCEQDIFNHTRQAVAFSLLKAIVARKMTHQMMEPIMEKVAKISITADHDEVRLQARQVFHQYLMNYPLDKKLEKHLNWYLLQLEYELQPGRESALEMIRLLINTLPPDVLKEQGGVIFLSITARLVNDDVPACRKMAADMIILLLNKSTPNSRDTFFEIALEWLKDSKIIHRRLAVQLCGLFATQDKASFKQKLNSVLPEIVNQVRQESLQIKPQVGEDEEGVLMTKEQLKDHHLYQLMHLAVKLSSLYPSMLTDATHAYSINSLAESAKMLLAHAHEWVRLAAAQLLGRVLSTLTPATVANWANNEAETQEEGYLRQGTRATLRSLALDLCCQLTPGKELNDKLMMQTMKNLIFLAEVLQHVHAVQEDNKLSLQWLIRKINKVIHMEVTYAPTFTVLRTMCYNWLAALVVKVDEDKLAPLMPLIMAPIARQLNIPDNQQSSLHQVAMETAKFVKKKIGSDEYNRLLTSLTTKLQIRRAERKKERAQMVVREPEKAAKRKISKQLKKKDQKKKKIELIKSGKLKKKTKKKDSGFDSP